MQIFAIRMLKCACVSARLCLCVRVGVWVCVCSDNWNQNKTKTGNTIAKTAQVLWQCVSEPLCMCCLCAHSSCHIDKGHNRRYQSKQQERLCAVAFALAHLTLNVLQERGRERGKQKRQRAKSDNSSPKSKLIFDSFFIGFALSIAFLRSQLQWVAISIASCSLKHWHSYNFQLLGSHKNVTILV